MKRTISILIGLFMLLSAGVLFAQEEKKAEEKKAAKVKAADLDRVSGTIKMVNKDTSTITVRTRQNVERQVVYSNDTKVTEMNKAGGKIEDLKDGVRIIAVGKFDDKARLSAARIDIRQK